MNITILGNGSWGTALALTLCQNNKVILWGPLPDEMKILQQDKENKKYLPGKSLEQITISSDLETAVKDAQILLLVIPTKFVRSQIAALAPLVKSSQIIVSATKGIEIGTFKRVSEIVLEYLPLHKALCALSGPSHAEEVAEGIPSAVTVASADENSALIVQEAFMTKTFRIYSNSDITGVEIGGAVKNVIAIAAGISHGLNFGSNTLSALMTRGMAEIVRLGRQMGARTETFYGLSGIGDLITTCVSEFSRNHFVGKHLAQGLSLAEIEAKMVMIAEGVNTVKAVHEYCIANKVSMPICEAVYDVMYNSLAPREAVLRLMTRGAKTEEFQ